MTLRVGSIDRLAPVIADALERTAPHEALRWVAEFVWDLDHAPPDNRAALLTPCPESTGDCAWDALLAGVAEMLAHRHQLRVPPWSADPSRFLDSWWFFSDNPAWMVSAFTHAPAALANRGVFIHAAALESV
ncbi:MAG: hypothetical protein ACR2HR_04890 [Euzebya sp.]